MSEVQMYWFLKLDDIKVIFENIGAPFLIIAVVAFIGFITAKIIYSVSINDKHEQDTAAAAKVVVKFIFPIMLIGCIIGTLFLSGACLVPSTKQMAAIYVVPKIANNKQIQEIPSKLLTLSSEWLEELRPENIKESAKTVVQHGQPEKTADTVVGDR